TVTREVCTVSVSATGWDVKTTLLPASVTVYDARACCCWLTAFSTLALTSTGLPGSVNGGVASTSGTLTKAGRNVTVPGADTAISDAPSAMAVTLKPAATRALPVSVTARVTPSGPPAMAWPGCRVIEGWLNVNLRPAEGLYTIKS